MQPEHDPILCVYLACRTCGRISYPTEATMLDEHQLLGDFDTACQHVTAGWSVVDLRQVGPREWCHAPTRTGIPCRNRFRRCRHHRRRGGDRARSARDGAA